MKKPNVMARRNNQNAAAALLQAASSRYPFLTKYKPLVSYGSGEGYAETWPIGEEGDEKYKRPQEFPLDRVGVQVFKPDKFGPSDLAAEFLHVDPRANEARSMLLSSLTPQQIIALKRNSGDYAESIRMGLPENRALQNAVDSALRGYTIGQWPEEANRSMGYTPSQMQVLNNLKSYMETGN